MYIKEKDFERQMKEEVLPFLEERKISGFSNRLPNRNIYYEGFLLEESVGNVVIVHGYSECTRKFDEMTYYFLQHGYQVFRYDQVGHGYSHRYVKDNPSLIHVEHFEEYVTDLHYLIEHEVKEHGNGKPVYLFGHSMGGAVVAYYLELYPKGVKKAILSAPMLEMVIGKGNKISARILAGWKVRNGHKYDFMIGKGSFNGKKPFEKSSSNSSVRYQYVCDFVNADERYQTCSGSYGWLYQALLATRQITSRSWMRRVQAKVLIFQAGKDTLVRPEGIIRFASHTPHTKIEQFPNSKHELFSNKGSQLEIYWKKIFDFLKED